MRFGDASIRGRLTAVILLITLVSLGTGFSIVALRQVRSLRQQRVAAAAVIAAVVADYSVSTLAFGDQRDAEDALARLRVFPDVGAGALYDAHGALFASWSIDGKATGLPTTIDVREPRRSLDGDRIEIRHPIEYNHATWGAIALRASTGTLGAELHDYLATLGMIALLLVLLSVMAAHFLGRLITRPIVELTDVARRISADHEATVSIPVGSSGELVALASALDVMLKRLAARDQALRMSLGTLRAVIDASPLGIIGIDRRRVVTLWNRGAHRLFNVPEDHALGRMITNVAPGASLEPLWDHSVAAGEFASVDVHLSRVGGGATELVCSTAPLVGPDGEALGAVVVVVDDTERRMAAEALAERAVQLQRAQKMEVVGRLAGGVAHDFNNLLTVVMTSCQLLQRRVDERSQPHVRNILGAAERGSALARRLLAFSRQQALDRRVIDVSTVITDLERMLRTVMGEHTEVRLALDDVPAGVEIDQGQLEQVLLNLALNARDAMPRGGELTIRTTFYPFHEAAAAGAPRRLGGDWVALSVQDTGQGMSAETASRVFEPFFTTKTHGTGLGLATALVIVHEAGGDIKVDSAPGKGTKFTLWLPRAAGTGYDESSTRDLPVKTGAETILLVEDEPVVRAVARELLTEAGYTVIEAQDGADGLERAGDGSLIDLLITDVVMPRMSGPELAQALAARRPGLPILYMSGYVGDALDHLGVDDGAGRTILQKPFTADALLRRVREVLDLRPSQRHRRPSSLAPATSSAR